MITNGVIRKVSINNGSEIPSTPIAYWVEMTSIQSTVTCHCSSSARP